MKFGFWRGRRERELDEEIESHLRMAVDDLVDRSKNDRDARLIALRQFGNVGLIKEVTRDIWGWASLDRLVRDVGFGVRMMRRNAAFTAVAAFTLALGIGASTAIFSIARAVVLEPLPFKDPGRLVCLYQSNLSKGRPLSQVSAPDFKDWRTRQTGFESIAALEPATFNLTGSSDPQRLAAARITADLLPTLGITPLIGRGFLPDEETASSNHVVLLSYSLWQREFGGRDLAGMTAQLDGESYNVVGVLPPDFHFPDNRDLWVPLVLNPPADPWRTMRADRTNRGLSVFGRIRPGVTIEGATAQISGVCEQLQHEYPLTNEGWGIGLRSLYDVTVPAQVRRSILVLFIAVALLLLLACANVANLMLARAGKRQREIAIRVAMGATRATLLRALLTESLLLSCLGGCGGLLLSFAATRWIAASGLPGVPRLSHTRTDLGVLLFSLLV
ncbi:MAG TPA: ABC transporter permease, partial [Blastocatellia bacterium]